MRHLGLHLSLGFTDLIVELTDMLQVATVQLTDAQIKTLPSTSIEVVADPGAGKYLIPVMATMEWDLAHGYYSNITQNDALQGASDIVITWGQNYLNAFRAVPMSDIGGVFSIKRTSICPPEMPKSAPIVVEDGLWANTFGGLPAHNELEKNLMVSADNSGNFTGGGTGNKVTVTVWYLVRTDASLTN